MNVETMRDFISRVYDTQTWKEKCRKMYDDQVIAIYYKFLRAGKFQKMPEKKKVQPNTNKYEQLNMFNFIDNKV